MTKKKLLKINNLYVPEGIQNQSRFHTAFLETPLKREKIIKYQISINENKRLNFSHHCNIKFIYLLSKSPMGLNRDFKKDFDDPAKSCQHLNFSLS